MLQSLFCDDRFSRKGIQAPYPKKNIHPAIESTKAHFQHISLQRISGLLGISRQAYYKSKMTAQKRTCAYGKVLEMVIEQRKHHPRLGTRKLYHMLKPTLGKADIKLGRDAFFSLLQRNNLLLRQRKRRTYAQNNPAVPKYPNLIRQLEVTSPNQVWVSDITYWPLKIGFLYISLITDAYSRKIVGYAVANHLGAENNIAALQMAIKDCPINPKGLIHHSDQGSQYYSKDYLQLLCSYGIETSMSAIGSPGQNAIAERVNGTLKQEYLAAHSPRTLQEAKKLVGKAVRLYNRQRPHLSCGLYTPEQIHNQKQVPKRLWQPLRKVQVVNLGQD